MLRNPSVFTVAGLGDLLCCFSKRMGGRGAGGGVNGASNPEPPLNSSTGSATLCGQQTLKGCLFAGSPVSMHPRKRKETQAGTPLPSLRSKSSH